MLKRYVFDAGIVQDDRGLGLPCRLAKKCGFAPVRFDQVKP